MCNRADEENGVLSMKKVSVEEFLANSGINHNVKIYLKTGKDGLYILKGMDTESLYVKDIVGFDYRFPVETIKAMELPDIVGSKKQNLEKAEINKLNKFIKEKNKLAGDVFFKALDLFKNEISILSERVGSDLLKEYLTTNKLRIAILNKDQAEEFLASFQKLTVRQEVEKYVINVGRIIILLSSKRYKECIAQCFEMLVEADKMENKRKVYLCLAFVMNQLKDDDQSFYWLEKYFISGIHILKEESNYSLWWRYLKNTVEFASYERLDYLLEQVFEFDPDLSCESLAYVLALNNINIQASHVISCIGLADLSWETVYSAFLHLKSEKDNKYHRLLRCIDDIKSKDRYRVFNGDQGIKGLVFDYVPYRSYGFIIGYDMIKYYFHSENTSPITLKSIRNEICSIKNLAEESLCMVTFSRNNDCKRAYEAFDVV